MVVLAALVAALSGLAGLVSAPLRAGVEWIITQLADAFQLCRRRQSA